MGIGDSVPKRAGLGTGIYSIHEAARLLKEPAQKLSRWAEGYVWKRNGEVRSSGPVLERENSEPGLLTFYDLIELAFVREFRKAGVELPRIRQAARVLRDAWKTPYPFALNLIATEGRQLLLQSEDKFEDVVTKQSVFDFANLFFKDIVVDDMGLATQWYPLGKNHLVVVDPHRSFGAPIIINEGIRTEILYRQYLVEQDIETVADWFEVSCDAVKQAIEFEEKWSQKVA